MRNEVGVNVFGTEGYSINGSPVHKDEVVHRWCGVAENCLDALLKETGGAVVKHLNKKELTGMLMQTIDGCKEHIKVHQFTASYNLWKNGCKLKGMFVNKGVKQKPEYISFDYEEVPECFANRTWRELTVSANILEDKTSFFEDFGRLYVIESGEWVLIQSISVFGTPHSRCDWSAEEVNKVANITEFMHRASKFTPVSVEFAVSLMFMLFRACNKSWLPTVLKPFAMAVPHYMSIMDYFTKVRHPQEETSLTQDTAYIVESLRGLGVEITDMFDLNTMLTKAMSQANRELLDIAETEGAALEGYADDFNYNLFVGQKTELFSNTYIPRWEVSLVADVVKFAYQMHKQLAIKDNKENLMDIMPSEEQRGSKIADTPAEPQIIGEKEQVCAENEVDYKALGLVPDTESGQHRGNLHYENGVLYRVSEVRKGSTITLNDLTVVGCDDMGTDTLSIYGYTFEEKATGDRFFYIDKANELNYAVGTEIAQIIGIVDYIMPSKTGKGYVTVFSICNSLTAKDFEVFQVIHRQKQGVLRYGINP